MRLIDTLERKLGRFAIRNLMLYIIIIYAFGFVLCSVNPEYYLFHLSLNFSAIFEGEVWRLVTFICYPPDTNIILFVLYSFIFFSIGRALESYWGAFRFNLYIFLGYFGEVLAALLIYLIFDRVYLLTASNLYLSMLLGIAATVPDAQFLLYFIIPVKAKWLGFFYGLILIYRLIISPWEGRIEIILSLLNFFVFFFFIRKPLRYAASAARRASFRAGMIRGRMERERPAGAGASHRCSVCGITDKDDPTMDFRYCSQCDGAREYCRDHIFTHIHVHDERAGKS